MKAGCIHKIKWASTRLIKSVKIKAPINNGVSWTNIADATDDHAFNWTVLNNPAENCLIHVGAGSGSFADVSNAVFPIAAPYSLGIMSPNCGERWEAGYIQSFTWTSIGTIGDVRIEYYTDNGTTCRILGNCTGSTGNYKWKIPGTSKKQRPVYLHQNKII